MRVASRWAEGGGLVAAELKKNEDETEGKEEVEPESGLSGRDTAGLAVDDIRRAPRAPVRLYSPLPCSPQHTITSTCQIPSM